MKRTNCITCNILLTKDNLVKNGCRNGVQRFNVNCKKCHSIKNIANDAKEIRQIKRRVYINQYKRNIGVVKKYPCKICFKPCYKKYALAFCSNLCRFMNYVKQTQVCWIWTGAKNKQGYGVLCYNGTKKMPAHRVSYLMFRGSIPENLFICHSCDNKWCVNPAHLWAGTHQDNVDDYWNKKRKSNCVTK